MFMVSEETAAAVRAVYRQDGEWAAVVELRRHFPVLKDNGDALRCVRVIAGWPPHAGAQKDQ